MTISSHVQIKKNTENAGITGFLEWNVNCRFLSGVLSALG